jgi:hypothetical protein
MMLSLLFLFSCLQLADAYTTYRILSTGGKEVNPVMRWLMDQIGIVQGLSLMKLLLIGLVVAAYNETLTFWLCVSYTLVVGWNTYQLLKDKDGV